MAATSAVGGCADSRAGAGGATVAGARPVAVAVAVISVAGGSADSRADAGAAVGMSRSGLRDRAGSAGAAPSDGRGCGSVGAADGDSADLIGDWIRRTCGGCVSVSAMCCAPAPDHWPGVESAASLQGVGCPAAHHLDWCRGGP